MLFIHSQNSFHLWSIRLNWFFIMFSYAFLKSPCTLFIVHRKQTTTKDTTTLNMTHWHRISSSRKSVCLKRAIFMTNCEGYQSYSADTAYMHVRYHRQSGVITHFDGVVRYLRQLVCSQTSFSYSKLQALHMFEIFMESELPNC